jgi:hypothetical protein
VQKKSITGGLNKLQRDSMGDTGSGNLESANTMTMMQQMQTPNFYEMPTSQ